MLEYRGRSEEFRKTFDTYGSRLAKIYKDILRSYLGGVERLTTPGLFYTPERGSVTVKSVQTEIDDLFQKNATFFMQSMEITHPNEAVTRELDRRVLGALGYSNVEPWINYIDFSNEKGLEYVAKRDENRRKNLAKMDSRKLVDYIGRWDETVLAENTILTNLLQSCRRYRVQKITAEQAGGAETIMSAENSMSVASDLDNLSGTAIISPPASKIKIQDDGTFYLDGTSRILTAPSIVLSDDGVDLIRDDLSSTDLPPYLVAFVHEYDHFVGYCIQKYPFNVVAGLLHLKTIEA